MTGLGEAFFSATGIVELGINLASRRQDTLIYRRRSMPIDDESGEYIAPQKTYLDDIEIYDAELGGVVPAWKSLIYHGVKARHLAMARADSASAVDQHAGFKQPPPLVADAIAKAETDLMLRVKDALDALDHRMTQLEQKADERDRQAAAEQALALAEDIAENAPQALLSSLADRAARLH
jgi:hypothetical protein